MNVLPLPVISGATFSTSSRHAGSDVGDGVRMRARRRHLATVVTVCGDVDAVTSDRVRAFAERFVRVGNALIFDLTGVAFFGARGISVLIAVDEACRSAGVPFVLVSNPIVSRVMRLAGCDTVIPVANSVPATLRQLGAMAQERDAAAPSLVSTSARTSRPEPADGVAGTVSFTSVVAAVLPPPAFSLGSALRWLGHDCPGHRCARAPIDAMDAAMWFIRRGPGFGAFPQETHVLVDPGVTGDAVTAIHQLIRQVNRCTHGDAIVVRPRPCMDLPRRPTLHRAPVPRLPGEHATRLPDVAGPSEGDLRLMETTR